MGKKGLRSLASFSASHGKFYPVNKISALKTMFTDPRCQYTSEVFTAILKAKQINISMDGKGRALDNVFVERLWRTVKQEEVYLKGYRNVSDCRKGLRANFDRYNNLGEHQSLDYNYPAEMYFGDTLLKPAG